MQQFANAIGPASNGFAEKMAYAQMEASRAEPPTQVPATEELLSHMNGTSELLSMAAGTLNSLACRLVGPPPPEAGAQAGNTVMTAGGVLGELGSAMRLLRAQAEDLATRARLLNALI